MGLGQSINTFTPYIMPQIPFGAGYPFGLKQSSETPEEAEERKKKAEADKAAKEFMKRLELMKQHMEDAKKLKAQINDMEEGKKEINDTINKAKSGKEAEDGTIKIKETWEDYNKLTWWKKGLRGASHLVQGTWKLATGFFGYETNPKTGESEWNWKKCLKNTAIAAGCIALTAIPVVGPVISTGLLATGVVCGTIGTVKGVKKAIDAKTPEELDRAYQDMGAGLTIGISSAVGLRGLGKGLQANAAASGTGSLARSTSENAISQFVKDATINTYRATVNGIKTDMTSVNACGFWKTYGTNLHGMIPKLGKSKFEKARYDTNQSINSRLNEINQELNNTSITPIKKALLEQEKLALDIQKAELRNTLTKDSWKALKSNSKAHNEAKSISDAIKEMETTGSTNINGTAYDMSRENISALKEALSRSEKLSKEIENLAKVRSATMKKMALTKKFKTEVEAYTGKARNSRLGRLYDTAKLSKSDITWKKALTSPFKFLWEATMIPFKPWNYVQSSPTSTVYKIEETFAPMYEAGFLTTGFIGEALGMGDKTMTTKSIVKDENGEEQEVEVAVTKEVITKLEEEVKQYDNAIAKVKSELNQLYLA